MPKLNLDDLINLPENATHYEVLGFNAQEQKELLAENSEKQQNKIRNNYRQICALMIQRRDRPRFAAGPNEQMSDAFQNFTKRVQEAMAVLSDPERKKAYDAELAAEAKKQLLSINTPDGTNLFKIKTGKPLEEIEGIFKAWVEEKNLSSEEAAQYSSKVEKVGDMTILTLTFPNNEAADKFFNHLKTKHNIEVTEATPEEAAQFNEALREARAEEAKEATKVAIDQPEKKPTGAPTPSPFGSNGS